MKDESKNERSRYQRRSLDPEMFGTTNNEESVVRSTENDEKHRRMIKGLMNIFSLPIFRPAMQKFFRFHAKKDVSSPGEVLLGRTTFW